MCRFKTSEGLHKVIDSVCRTRFISPELTLWSRATRGECTRVVRVCESPHNTWKRSRVATWMVWTNPKYGSSGNQWGIHKKQYQTKHENQSGSWKTFSRARSALWSIALSKSHVNMSHFWTLMVGIRLCGVWRAKEKQDMQYWIWSVN